MITTPTKKIWAQLKFVSECPDFTEDQNKIILPVLQQEASAREVRKIKKLITRSGIKRIKRLEDFDWKFNPKIPRNEILKFTDISWNTDVKNLVMIGSSGVGKSHLASAMCYRALQKGIPAAFITCFDLVQRLKKASNKHSLLNYYSNVNLLCLDELGYVFPNQDQANDIFQIISKRSELTSTIVTTNLIPSQWGKVFEASTATAILDRLNMNGTFLAWEGPSYRGKK